MYRKSDSWRKHNKVDQLINWKPPPVVSEYYPGCLAGYDDENCPVWIIPFGGADVKGN